MSNLIKIVYVGKKPTAFDNVTKSGKSWKGHGDVQEVTAEQAKQLLKFPDQWDVLEADDAGIVGQTDTTEVVGEDGESVQIEHTDLLKPLERLTKDELVALAKAKWGKELDAKSQKKLLIDAIEEFERDLEPVAQIG